MPGSLTKERRRLLKSSKNPPTPVLWVYPSLGNTITLSSGASRDGLETISVTNNRESTPTDVADSAIVCTDGYQNLYSTVNGTQGTNMVWLYAACYGRPANLIVEVIVDYYNSTTSWNETVETTYDGSGSLVDVPSVRWDSVNGFSGSTTPNYGNAYIDHRLSPTYIVVRTRSKYRGGTTYSPETTITINFDQSQSISAPKVTPISGTYTTTQYMTIDPDPTYVANPSFSTYYTVSSSGYVTPTQSVGHGCFKWEGTPHPISESCYVSAKSFLGAYSSSETRCHYTISGGGSYVDPPLLVPHPGTFEEPVTVSIQNQSISSNVSIYYTTDGTQPTTSSQLYDSPFTVTSTTVVKAVAYDSSNHLYSNVVTGTYTIVGLQTNDVSVVYNSDGTSSCGLYNMSGSNTNGDQKTDYGFCINASAEDSTIYYTFDGTTPTTSSLSIPNRSWYFFTENKTTLVKYLVVSPTCPPVIGEFWVRINQSVAVFVYDSAKPFLVGTTESYWLSKDLSNYSSKRCAYLYLDGKQIFPEDLVFREVEVNIGGLMQTIGLLLYSPPSGTQIDAKFRFIYSYYGSDPSECPLNFLQFYGQTNLIFDSMKSSMFTDYIGMSTVYSSSNESTIFSCAGQLNLSKIVFSGDDSPYVRPCTRLGYLNGSTIMFTQISSIDLSPCSSMTTLLNGALGFTCSGMSRSATALSSVTMPYNVTSLGDRLFANLGASQTFTPLTVTFFSNPQPSASYYTFKKYSGTGEEFIDSSSTIVVSSWPNNASVCTYKYRWKDIERPKTQMRLVDENGYECNQTPGTIPSVTSGSATAITATSATISGNNVTSNGGLALIRRGVCWSDTNPTPKVTDNHKDSGSSLGAYNVSLTGLSSSTTYYCRAYAENPSGIAYGQTIQFRTLQVVTPPTVEQGQYSQNASSFYNVSGRKISTGWTVVENGGSPLTALKVVYSTTNSYPTISDSQVSAEDWIEDSKTHFSGTIDFSGFTVGTKIYIRGAAQNSSGWGYSGEVFQYTVPNTYNWTEPKLQLRGVYWPGDESNPGNPLFEVYLASLGTNVQINGIGVCYGTSHNPTYGSATTIWSSISGYILTGYHRIQGGSVSTNTTYYARGILRITGPDQIERYCYSGEYAFTKPIGSSFSDVVDTIDAYSAEDFTTLYGKLKKSFQQLVSGTSYTVVGLTIIWQSRDTEAYPIKSNVDLYEINSVVAETIDQNNASQITIPHEFSSSPYTSSSSSSSKKFTACVELANPAEDPEELKFIYGMTKEFSYKTWKGPFTVSDSTGNDAVRYSAKCNCAFVRRWSVAKAYCWNRRYVTSYGKILDEPWEYVKKKENVTSDTYWFHANNYRDLFGWGCTSQEHRPELWHAYSMDLDPTNFYAYDNPNSSLVRSENYDDYYYGYASWGHQTYRDMNGGSNFFNSWFTPYNEIDSTSTGIFGTYDVGNPTSTNAGMRVSRTLNSEEVNYMLFNRTTSSGHRFFKANVVGTNGLVILPDDWVNNSPISISNYDLVNSDYSTSLSKLNWYQYFGDCVFLPAAGYMYGSPGMFSTYTLTYVGDGTIGMYWLNDSCDARRAYALFFAPGSLSVIPMSKNICCSVHLFLYER